MYIIIIIIVFCNSGLVYFGANMMFFFKNCFCRVDLLEDDVKPEKVG